MAGREANLPAGAGYAEWFGIVEEESVDQRGPAPKARLAL